MTRPYLARYVFVDLMVSIWIVPISQVHVDLTGLIWLVPISQVCVDLTGPIWLAPVCPGKCWPHWSNLTNPHLPRYVLTLQVQYDLSPSAQVCIDLTGPIWPVCPCMCWPYRSNMTCLPRYVLTASHCVCPTDHEERMLRGVCTQGRDRIKEHLQYLTAKESLEKYVSFLATFLLL